MTYLARLQIAEPDETWQSMELAANLRYQEALELIDNHQYLGALYLLGYVAEMRLKVAYCRLKSITPSTNITSIVSRTSAFRARSISAKNAHDVKAWKELLFYERIALGKSISPIIAAKVNSAADKLNDLWEEVLRYRSTLPTEEELYETWDAVETIDKYHNDLWR